MKFEKLKEIIENSDNIVFFGGAGVSTESNIPDFRSASGLYSSNLGSTFSPETILSHSFFYDHTSDFYDFYKNKMIYKDATPNDAHIALSRLEQLGKLKAVITQNIDGLHQAAGAKNVLELHGSVHRNHCVKCNKSYPLEYIINSIDIPICNDCNGIIKPDVVLYGESLDIMTLNLAVSYIENCDVLIIGGTSLNVYPAAGLIKYFKGTNLVLINNSATVFDNNANLVIRDNIGKAFSFILA